MKRTTARILVLTVIAASLVVLVTPSRITADAIKIYNRFAQLLDVNWASIGDGQTIKRSGTMIVGSGSPTALGLNKDVCVTVHVPSDCGGDGMTGCEGTYKDPFDGSTQTKFDAILAAVSAETHIHLGPGTFLVTGQTSGNSNVKSSQWIQGSGPNVTTVKMTGGLLTGGSFVSALAGNADYVTISDVTIDANWNGMANTADNGATVRSVGDGVTNGTPTVTSATLVLTVNDLHSVVVSTDVPANTYIGIINSPTSLGLSSSPTSNVPVNATGSHTGQTVALKEKNTKTGAVALFGTNNTLRNVVSINTFGSFANNLEQFALLLGTPTGGPDSVDNTIDNCTAKQPYGNYGATFALFGNSSFKIRNSKVINSKGIGINSGSDSGFNTGGVNVAYIDHCLINGNTFTDCDLYHHDTGSADEIIVSNNRVIRGHYGITAGVVATRTGFYVLNNDINIQNRDPGLGASNGILIVQPTSNNVVVSGNRITIDRTGLSGTTFLNQLNLTGLNGATIGPNYLDFDSGNGTNTATGSNVARLGNRIIQTGNVATGLTDNVVTAAVTFANRPASPVEGMLQPFTDSTTATWGATITGTGSNHVIGYYDGTNWTVMGK